MPTLTLIKEVKYEQVDIISKIKKRKVPPRFELGSLDSKSRVLTITPWNPTYFIKCEIIVKVHLFTTFVLTGS